MGIKLRPLRVQKVNTAGRALGAQGGRPQGFHEGATEYFFRGFSSQRLSLLGGGVGSQGDGKSGRGAHGIQGRHFGFYKTKKKPGRPGGGFTILSVPQPLFTLGSGNQKQKGAGGPGSCQECIKANGKGRGQ